MSDENKNIVKRLGSTIKDNDLEEFFVVFHGRRSVDEGRR